MREKVSRSPGFDLLVTLISRFFVWISSREFHIFTHFSNVVLRCDSAFVSADFAVSKSGRSSTETRRIAAS